MTTIADRGAGHQVRDFNLTDYEFRGEDSDTGWTFEGVASVVDAAYTVRDQFGEFTETIVSGAFDRSIREATKRSAKASAPGLEPDVALFINHRHADVPLASTFAGTLRLGADPHIRVSADLDRDRSDVVIARSAVMRGELRQMSVGMFVVRDKWNKDMTERMITEARLDEVSIVRRGANHLTSSAMRSFDELIESLTDIDMTEDEMRRAIAAFEARLPQPETPDLTDIFAERDRQDRERLERKRLLRPSAY
jgi:HK97 family phage prohead protease